jgi:hypothetical protein
MDQEGGSPDPSRFPIQTPWAPGPPGRFREDRNTWGPETERHRAPDENASGNRRQGNLLISWNLTGDQNPGLGDPDPDPRTDPGHVIVFLLPVNTCIPQIVPMSRAEGERPIQSRQGPDRKSRPDLSPRKKNQGPGLPSPRPRVQESPGSKSPGPRTGPLLDPNSGPCYAFLEERDRRGISS